MTTQNHSREQIFVARPRSVNRAKIELMHLTTIRRKDGDDWYVQCTDCRLGRFMLLEDAQKEFSEHVAAHNSEWAK